MIINSRKDLDNAPAGVRESFMTQLAASINRWQWQDGKWSAIQETTTIGRYGFTVSDFPDAFVPDKPTNNPDNVVLEQRREYLKDKRNAYISAPINSIQVTTSEDRENIQGAVDNFELLYPDGTAYWITVDNNIVPIAKADLEAVIQTYVTRKAQAFNHYGQLLSTLTPESEWGL